MHPPSGSDRDSLPVDALETGLTDAVRRMLGVPRRHIVEARTEPLIYDAFLAHRTVSRVRGSAETPSGLVDWSLIQKVTEGPDLAAPYLYDNGLREFRAYESGLLDDLASGVRAARAHGLHRSTDGRLVLWLEDLGGDRRPLSHQALIQAAGHLGRLAGRWRGRVPRHPWMFTGWIDRHRQPEAIAPAQERIRTLRAPGVIEERLGHAVADIEALIADQTRIAGLLADLPQTLCHHDAVGSNVFAGRSDADGETVLIDWEMVGPGPAGADLASLIFSSARRGDLPASLAIEAFPDAREAYAAGMETVAGGVDRAQLETAVDATIALRWVLLRDIIVALEDGTPVRRGSAPDEPPHAALDQLIALAQLLFAAAERTRLTG